MTTQQLLKVFERTHSKAEMSKITGIRLATFYDWENGQSMKFEKAVEISKALKLNLGKILTTNIR